MLQIRRGRPHDHGDHDRLADRAAGDPREQHDERGEERRRRAACRGTDASAMGALGQPPAQMTRLLLRHSSSPTSASTAATSDPSRIASATASMSAPSGRSSRSRGESDADDVVRRARAAARLERREKLDRLRGGEQLDRERALGVRDDLPRLQPGRVAHRHVILLPGARRDRVDRCRVAERLVLGDERCGHVLRDHEPRVEPAVGREERRQPVAQVRVDEALDAALGDARELGHRHRERVERERERLPVEVPGRDEHAVLDEHERVVGRRVQLGRDRVLDVVEEVARRAVHLRRAAQRVRVLHLVAPAVRLDDRRALEQPEHVARRRAADRAAAAARAPAG